LEGSSAVITQIRARSSAPISPRKSIRHDLIDSATSPLVRSGSQAKGQEKQRQKDPHIYRRQCVGETMVKIGPGKGPGLVAMR
jgi:hypothetical protein